MKVVLYKDESEAAELVVDELSKREQHLVYRVFTFLQAQDVVHCDYDLRFVKLNWPTLTVEEAKQLRQNGRSLPKEVNYENEQLWLIAESMKNHEDAVNRLDQRLQNL